MGFNKRQFESSVNSYDSQTLKVSCYVAYMFESSVNSYDSQTLNVPLRVKSQFESSVNSYDSQTIDIKPFSIRIANPIVNPTYSV